MQHKSKVWNIILTPQLPPLLPPIPPFSPYMILAFLFLVCKLVELFNGGLAANKSTLYIIKIPTNK